MYVLLQPDMALARLRAYSFRQLLDRGLAFQILEIAAQIISQLVTMQLGPLRLAGLA
jgi:hypothetical protein